MKKTLIALCAAGLWACTGSNGHKFSIEGTVTNRPVRMVYLELNTPKEANPIVVDSSKVEKDGHFSISTQTKEEGLYSLRADTDENPFAMLISDVPKVTVRADLSRSEDPVITGSPASQSLIDLDKQVWRSRIQMAVDATALDSLSKIPNTPTTSAHNDSLRRQYYADYITTTGDLKSYVSKLIDTTASPSLTIYSYELFQRMLESFQSSGGFTPDEAKALANKTATRFPNHTVLQDWRKTVGVNRAPDFTLPDTSGRAVSLSSFKGKYVLLDFWASWCGPCRMENPNVVAAYQQFKDRNFTVLGVSLDKTRDSWLQAIHDDHLDWNQVSDLKYWDSDAAALYRVQSIPTNFLIDPDGNIVAQNLHGEELVMALKKFVK